LRRQKQAESWFGAFSRETQGYSVQVAESCHEGNAVEIITHVEVTEACASDAQATIPTLEALSQRGLHPEEMIADTTYGSGANAVAAEAVGIELVAPVGGKVQDDARAEATGDTRALTAADFDVDAAGQRPRRLPRWSRSGRGGTAERPPHRDPVLQGTV
jgi:hypothetical protein